MVFGFVLPPTVVRVPRRNFRHYEPVSFRSDGTTFVLWNSVTLIVAHTRGGDSVIFPGLEGVRNRSLVLGESSPSGVNVWVPRIVFALSQTVCEQSKLAFTYLFPMV